MYTFYKKSGIFIPKEYEHKQFYFQIKEFLKRRVQKYNTSDGMDRHDLIANKNQILYIYEKERSVQVEHNYLYFKTYWEQSNVTYPLE